MAASDLVNYTNPLTGILSSILGGESEQDIVKNGSTTGTSNQQQNQTGTTNTASTGNTSTTGQTGTAGTSTSTNTGTSTQSSNADISALQKVFAQQQAGVTPEMLSAIFTEGAKKVPALATAYGTAVGARASDNSPLATSVRDLQTNLTNVAATQNTQMLADSASTAAKIAELTKAMTTTNTGTTTGNQNQTQTTTGNTASTQNQTVDQILQNIINGTTSGTTKENTSNDTSNTVNTDVLKLLGGLGLGGTVLNSLLGSSGGLAGLIGGQGGSGGLLGLLTGAGTAVKGGIGTIGSILDGSYNANYGNEGLNWLKGGGLGDIGSADWYNQALTDIGIDPGSLSDFGSSLGADELNSLIDGGGDWGSWLSDLGWADGGAVDAKKTTATAAYSSQAQQRIALVQKAMVLKQLQSSPKGKALLALAQKQQAQKVQLQQSQQAANPTQSNGPSNSAPGTAPASPTGQSVSVGNAIGQAVASALMSAIVGPVPGLISNVVGMATTGKPQSFAAMMAAISAAQSANGGGDGANGTAAAGVGTSSGGSVSIGPVSVSDDPALSMDQAAVDAATDGTAAGGTGDTGSAAGNGTSGGTGPGSSGDGSGGVGTGDGGTGWANGGEIPGEEEGDGDSDDFAATFLGNGYVPHTAAQSPDPQGNKDTVMGRLSVGEYVVPTDVVSALGVDFFENLKDRYHTPAEMQRAMGVM